MVTAQPFSLKEKITIRIRCNLTCKSKPDQIIWAVPALVLLPRLLLSLKNDQQTVGDKRVAVSLHQQVFQPRRANPLIRVSLSWLISPLKSVPGFVISILTVFRGFNHRCTLVVLTGIMPSDLVM